jgi:uncharacterized protein (DUF433 family)
MTTDHLIVCSDEILGGTPVFKDTRVPIKNLIDYLEAGDNLDEFLDDFPSVSRAQAVQMLELAKEILLAQAHASST